MKFTGKKSNAGKRRERNLPRSGSGATPGLARWLPPLLIILLTVAAFLPTLRNEFVRWDDDSNFLENPYYRGLGWAQLRWMFTTFHMGHYQPLSWVTLGLDYLLWGMNPVGYHLTNLLLHAANALLFYFVTLRFLPLSLSNPPTPGTLALRTAAGFAALVFAIHPLRVESVAWATERRDVLSGLFFLSTILCYLRASTIAHTDRTCKRWLTASVLLYALSLLSKASGMTLPIVLLVIDVYPLGRLGGSPGGWFGPAVRRVWWEKIPFLVLALSVGIIALMAQREAEALKPLQEYGVIPRLAQVLFGIAFYLWKTVVPLGLSPLYEVSVDFDPFSWPFLLSGAVVLIISTSLIAMRRQWPAGLVVWICYLVILSPVLGIAQSGVQLVADRYTYLSCLGWAILTGGVLFYCWQVQVSGHTGQRTLVVVTGLATVVVVGLGVLTWHQAQVWHDSERLWRHALAADPISNTAHYNLAVILNDQGRMQEAIEHYREALRIKPRDADAHLNLGIALARQGQFNAAIEHYRQAVQIQPTSVNIRHILANTLADQGQFNEAIEHYRQAVQIQPTYSEAHFNLANTLAKLGKNNEAIQHYLKAVKIQPGFAQAYNNLGAALVRQGKLDEAIKHYQQAVKIQPAYAEAHFNLGLALEELGRLEEAMASYRTALDVAPKDWPFRQSVESQIHKTLARLRKGK